MDPITTAEQVAVVGTPSSNYEVTLDLLDTAIHEPLVGSMLLLTQPSGGGEELALGMVTEVTTMNQWHSQPLLRGVVKAKGHIPGMSGDLGDVRAASIKLQACYKRSVLGQPQSGVQAGPLVQAGPWVQAGPSLRMSPPTGTAVRRVTNEVLDELMSGEEDLHYLGHLHGTGDVRVPMSIRDFSGDRGAFHAGVFGMSGSGKTAFSAYFLAGQMRNADQGFIVVDPQGQFSSETGFPFSLQAWAAEMGREVVVRRVSEDLRLEKDAPLLGELLSKTKLTGEITKMAPETAGLFIDELVKALRKRSSWDTEDSDDLLRELLGSLTDSGVLGRIYVDETRQARLRDAVLEVLDDADRFGDVFSQFQPLHNLFSPANPGGGKRHSMWGTVAHVFDKTQRAGAPAPVLILDMSTSGQVSWVSSLLAGPEQAAAVEALRVLDQDSIKAAILRKACRTLKEASESAFRLGDTLNTMVVFDEAWRYAPPLHLAGDEEIKALSADIAGYFRDTRKFGIGWTLISQSPRSVNADCFDQMAVRIMGYGLGGADLAKVAEQMDDPEHLKLYRAFAPPDSTKPKVYPFMVTGPVSPLSFTRAPVFLAAYTDFETFRSDNHPWISQARRSQGLPVLSGVPQLRGTGPVVAARVPRPTATAGPVKGAAGTKEAMERVRENAATGGIAPGAFAGLAGDTWFGGGLGSIDDDDPPPF
ncbi:ATP-binding protein [Kineococcus radiotolerans]|uniref:ATPase-like n=1 Tax=Kineococcus radiotolerans (strain ATCC BAA-149 / DSM 14245 / SRS30216) TaxID=266940 RepID=A6WB41_KINRD|nr:ATP-binding protein [Kineococcus radiotolerans]ABS04030.1 ATPase-like [Kineococcus radiotolerans SRS30216 = ATCC BAA-149]